jgi:hypothetical protein
MYRLRVGHPQDVSIFSEFPGIFHKLFHFVLKLPKHASFAEFHVEPISAI